MDPKRLIALAWITFVASSLLGCPNRSTPIERGLTYLATNQIGPKDERAFEVIGVRDDAGNWPQVFYFENIPELRIRDVSPFMVAFIHHSLTLIVPENSDRLGLSDENVLTAHQVRVRAIEFMRQFESPTGALDAGTYGFWPVDSAAVPDESFLSALLFQQLQGPILQGSRVPVNLRRFPRVLAIPADADVTGAVYAALLDDSEIDNGPGTTVPFEDFFADWRHCGQVARRLNPNWLPHASGAFFTWLNYQPAGATPVANDVDLVVNATVLYALGRYGRLETAGVEEAIELINTVVDMGIHRTAFDEITNYYPDNFAFEYFVSKAYLEGGVGGLEPAVETLADEIERLASTDVSGIAYWDRGDPHLNTAFAILVLMNAGRETPLIGKGIEFLIREQNPVSGGWDENIFFIARMDSGARVNWASASLTTAIAVEALCRYTLL